MNAHDDDGTPLTRTAAADERTANMPAAGTAFSDGKSVGTAPLPNDDALAAVALAIDAFDLASVPVLPNLPGPTAAERTVELARSGSSGRLIEDRSFAAFRAIVDTAGTGSLDGSPVVWQHVGPVTLGVALCDAGLDVEPAFERAVEVTRANVVELADAIAEALPSSPQLVVFDEPALAELMSPDFPIPPDQAVDLMSSAMAAVATRATAGIQCARPCDLATMLASGPGVISVPVDPGLVEWAGYLARFHEDGGVVAWGLVPSDSPVALSADRYWRALSDLWCELVRRDCDPVALRRQSMITPGGRLDEHTVAMAERVLRMTAEVSARVKDQANATRFALGA